MFLREAAYGFGARFGVGDWGCEGEGGEGEEGVGEGEGMHGLGFFCGE